MWGMIAKITVHSGRREDMIAVLREGAGDMPGCLGYVVARDATNENAIWVTEVWDSEASHKAALSLPSVKDAITRGMEHVANFDRVAVTNPAWGVGLPAARES